MPRRRQRSTVARFIGSATDGPSLEPDPFEQVGVRGHDVDRDARCLGDVESASRRSSTPARSPGFASRVAAQVQGHQRHRLGSWKLERPVGPPQRVIGVARQHLLLGATRVELCEHLLRLAGRCSTSAIALLERLVGGGSFASQTELVVDASSTLAARRWSPASMASRSAARYCSSASSLVMPPERQRSTVASRRIRARSAPAGARASACW